MQNIKNIIIIGAGGHARVIADIVKSSKDNLIGFLDDNLDKKGKKVFEDKIVLGSIKDIKKYNDCYFVIGIGDGKIRKKIAQEYPNIKWYTSIHPKAIIGTNVKIGEGSVVMPGAVINSGSNIGKHCIINTSSSIDHDNVLLDYVHISPGAVLAGTVHIGEGTWVGSGATIINNINIAENNIIGAGSTIIRNIEETGGTYVSNISIRKIKK